MQIRKGILIFVIVGACVCSYCNAFFASFVWDDNIFIIPNPYMHSFRYLPQFFTKNFWKIGLISVESQYYRPLLAASFMLDFSLWKMNPFGFHLSNIIFHVLAGVLLFLFLDAVLGRRDIAFFSALIFGVHPAHAEVVSFVSGRVDSVPLVFFLFSLLLFFSYAKRNRRLRYYIGALLSFFLALLSKEMAVTLPLIVMIVDFLFISNGETRKVFKNFFRWHLAFFIVLGVYFCLRYFIVGVSITADEVVSVPRNFSYGIAPLWRLFTFIKIIAIYLRILFVPFDLRVEYLFKAANSLFEPVVFFGSIGLVALIFIAWKNARRAPALSFAILWFFVTILPVGNIVPQGNLFAERYVYTPSVGYCLAMGLLFAWLLKQKVRTEAFEWKKLMYVLFILWVVAFGKLAYARSAVWENDFTLWLDAVKKSPSSPVTHVNLAHAYFRIDELEKALEETEKAVRLAPFHAQPFIMLAHIYRKQGEFDKAIGAYQSALERNPEAGEVYNGLAVIYGKKGDYEKAITMGLRALEINPYLAEARHNLAVSYTQAGLIDEAIRAYEAFLIVAPARPDVHLAAGNLYDKKGDITNARKHWQAAVELQHDYVPALEALKSLQ